MLTRWPLVIENRRPRRRRRIAYWIAEALTGLVLIGAVIGAAFIAYEILDGLAELPLQ